MERRRRRALESLAVCVLFAAWRAPRGGQRRVAQMLWNLRHVGRCQEQCKKSAAQRGQHALTRDPFVATHRTEPALYTLTDTRRDEVPRKTSTLFVTTGAGPLKRKPACNQKDL